MSFWTAIDRFLDRLRPNVIIIAVLIAWLIADFGDKLIEKLPETVSSDILTALIGVGIGGLISALMRMFESASVPADVHERMMRELTEKQPER